MKIQDFIEIAWENFDKFGLTEKGWVFEINPKIHKIYGMCCYEDNLIIFSEKYILQRTIQENLLLIKHEISHVLAGYNHGHDKVWQEKCLMIGGDGKPTSSCIVRNSGAILLDKV